MREWFTPDYKLVPSMIQALQRQTSFYRPYNSGRVPLLNAHPDVRARIISTLKGVREDACPLDVVGVKAIMEAILKEEAPELLSTMKMGRKW